MKYIVLIITLCLYSCGGSSKKRETDGEKSKDIYQYIIEDANVSTLLNAWDCQLLELYDELCYDSLKNRNYGKKDTIVRAIYSAYRPFSYILTFNTRDTNTLLNKKKTSYPYGSLGGKDLINEYSTTKYLINKEAKSTLNELVNKITTYNNFNDTNGIHFLHPTSLIVEFHTKDTHWQKEIDMPGITNPKHMPADNNFTELFYAFYDLFIELEHPFRP